MKLIECYIENFGKLSDFRYSFSDGLNTIKEDNGYGKTTLTVFIKAMLYGLDDTRKVRLETNDRKHYLPWNAGRCGGSLCFESGGKKYRIERTFMPKASDDTFALYDVKNGKLSEDFSERVGEELFGIDCDGFERTVFLSENNLSGKNENRSVSAKLSDLVGCDGDLGVMDEALLLLEKQRKIYRKRGGTGEIGDIKKRIGEIDRRLYDLERIGTDFLFTENKLSSIRSELGSLYEKRGEVEQRNRQLDAERLRRNYEKQYLEMKAAVSEEEKKLESLREFFKNGLPTQTEIEDAKEAARTAQITLAENTQPQSDELSELESFFSSGVDEESIKKAVELSSLELQYRAEANRTSEDAKRIEEKVKGASLGSSSKIDSLIKDISSSKNVNKNWRILIPIGIITAVFLVGIILLVIGIRGYKAEKNSLTFEAARSRAEAILGGVSLSEIKTKDELIDRLYTEKARAANTMELLSELRELTSRAASLKERADAILREEYEFISRFPIEDYETPDLAIARIARKFELYTALQKSRAAADRLREEKIAEAKSGELFAAQFLSRFPTLTERPYDEISAKLIEYSAAKRSLERMSVSLCEFALEHKIDTGALGEQNTAPVPQHIDTEELSAKILESERERALLERQLKSLSDELEQKDELVAQKEELCARAEEYEAKLSVILKTMSYLEEAKDNLTSRYLSGTKAAFDKYVSLIGLEAGENFTMDTSFAVMKNERGTLRQTEAYSRGTRELYALCARFALVDSLYEKECPFIILDDPFAYFDDAKLSRALSVIAEVAKKKQIIYLTCTESRSA